MTLNELGRLTASGARSGARRSLAVRSIAFSSSRLPVLYRAMAHRCIRVVEDEYQLLRLIYHCLIADHPGGVGNDSIDASCGMPRYPCAARLTLMRPRTRRLSMPTSGSPWTLASYDLLATGNR